MQKRRNPSALAMELRLSCINPSIWLCHKRNPMYWVPMSFGKIFYAISFLLTTLQMKAFLGMGIPIIKITRSWDCHHYNGNPNTSEMASISCDNHLSAKYVIYVAVYPWDSFTNMD